MEDPRTVRAATIGGTVGSIVGFIITHGGGGAIFFGAIGIWLGVVSVHLNKVDERRRRQASLDQPNIVSSRTKSSSDDDSGPPDWIHQ